MNFVKGQRVRIIKWTRTTSLAKRLIGKEGVVTEIGIHAPTDSRSARLKLDDGTPRDLLYPGCVDRGVFVLDFECEPIVSPVQR